MPEVLSSLWRLRHCCTLQAAHGVLGPTWAVSAWGWMGTSASPSWRWATQPGTGGDDGGTSGQGRRSWALWEGGHCQLFQVRTRQDCWVISCWQIAAELLGKMFAPSSSSLNTKWLLPTAASCAALPKGRRKGGLWRYGSCWGEITITDSGMCWYCCIIFSDVRILRDLNVSLEHFEKEEFWFFHMDFLLI